MRINEILTESEIHQLDEGPMLDKAGTLVGKTVGGVAKGVGAVAGGVAGIGRAFKKGYAGGKAVVGGDPSPNADAPAPVADPNATPTPAPVDPKVAPVADPKVAPAPVDAKVAPADPNATPTPAPVDNEQPAAKDINAAGPKDTAPAANLTGAAKTAADKTAAVTQDQNAGQAGQTMYAQVKANINKLDKKGKQRILQLLQKSLQQAPAKPAAGAGAMGQMAGQLAKGGAAEPNTMANAPVSKTNTAKPGNPNAAPAAGGKKNLGFGFNTDTGEPFSSAEERTAAGEAGEMAAREYPATTPAAEVPVKKKRAPKKPAAPSQAEIDADRERVMGQTNDSIIRTHTSLAETLMKAIAKEKSRMVTEGKISIFRK